MRLFILLTLCVACFADDAPTEVEVSQAALANTKFGLDILAKVSGGNKNVFISPYSISAAIAMTSLGAAGNTLKEIEDVCYFKLVNTASDPKAIHKVYKELIEEYNKPNQNYSLSTANRLFGANNFQIKQSFQDDTSNYYHAQLQQLDFDGTAEKIINDWVEEQTHNKIKDLFKPGSLTPDTALVLANAIYFKGNWNSQFKKDQTQDEIFHSADNTNSTVKMMNQKNRFGYYHDSSDLNVKVLEMPYTGKSLSMVILLPDAVDGLPTLLQKLTAEKFQGLLNNLIETQVDVKFPKFKLETEYSLKPVLQQLGINDLFSSSSNLSNLSKNRTKVSEVVHKAFVDVDEQGTEAAAATGVAIVSYSLPAPPTQFYVKRPFVTVILDKKSKFNLFAGIVNKL